jgi:DNA polymerase III alpha subunit
MEQYYTELQDRILWFDGTFSVEPQTVVDYIAYLDTGKMYVTEINEDVKKYNLLVDNDKELTIKKQLEDFTERAKTWNIPKSVQNLDLKAFLLKIFDSTVEKNDLLREVKLHRLLREYEWFKQNNMENLIKTVIYVINTFIHHNVVWGIGRGSATSSYLLYLIGLHDVDPIKYNISEKDFMK